MTEFDPPRRMVTRIAHDTLSFDDSRTYKIRADGPRCSPVVTENGEMYNPVFCCLARFAFGYRATMERYRADLGREFGEDIPPARRAAQTDRRCETAGTP